MHDAMKIDIPARPVLKPRKRRWLRRLGLLLLALIAIGGLVYLFLRYRAEWALRDAVAELDRTDPGWRLNDVETAREPVVEADNSAPHVEAAAAILGPGHPSGEFEEELSRVSPQVRLSPDQADRLRTELGRFPDAVAEARKVLDKPRGRYPIHYRYDAMYDPPPHLARVRAVARLLCCDARLRAEQGDAAGALTSCRAAVNVGSSLGDEPLSWSQAIRRHCAFTACRAAERVLGQCDDLADADLAALQPLLEREAKYPGLEIALRGERAFVHEALAAVERGDLTLYEMRGSPPPPWAEQLVYFHIVHWARADHPKLLGLMTDAVAAARLPEPERGPALDRVDLRARQGHPSPVISLVAYAGVAERVSSRTVALLRCTDAALALERYRLKHGDWPASLDRLCPEFLAAVPLDPYDGKPLRYRKGDDGTVVVYAIGPDREDNGGHLDDDPYAKGADIGCRLWKPALRHRPPPAAEEVPAQ